LRRLGKLGWANNGQVREASPDRLKKAGLAPAAARLISLLKNAIVAFFNLAECRA
jgi:hypothetical protein